MRRTAAVTGAVRLAATLCALAVGALAAGCGGSATGVVTTVPASTTTGAGATTPAAPLTLDARVPTAEEFTSFVPVATQIVNLDDFADEVDYDDDGAAAQAQLGAAGFRRGVLRAYDTPAAAQALAFVAEVSPDAAPGLVDAIVTQAAELSGEPGLKVTRFTIDEAGGARGAEIAGTSNGGQIAAAIVVFADGAYVYGLQSARQDGGGSPLDAVRTAAVAWHARVAGAPAAPETGTTATTPGAGAQAPFPDAGEIALLTHVPTPTADDCGRTAAGARAAGALTSVRCDTESHRVYYEQFATAEDTQTAYDGYLEANGIVRGEGTTCDDGAPAEGTWDGDDDRVVCFRNDAGVWVVWSSAELRLVAVAFDADGTVRQLFGWWKGPGSGPIG